MRKMTMPAGKFKAECLKVMDEVQRTKVHVVITKRNVPVAEVVPIVVEEKRSGFGCMKGTIHVLGNIIDSTHEEWDADR